MIKKELSVSSANDECVECWDRNNNKGKCIVKLEMIDYYLKLSYKKDIISKKKFESISNYLLEIKKMLFGWKNYEESK